MRSLEQRIAVRVKFMLMDALGTTLPWMPRVAKRTKRRRTCRVPDQCSATHACRPNASIWIQIHCPLCPLNYERFSSNLRVHFLGYERSWSEPAHSFPCGPWGWGRYWRCSCRWHGLPLFGLVIVECMSWSGWCHTLPRRCIVGWRHLPFSTWKEALVSVERESLLPTFQRSAEQNKNINVNVAVWKVVSGNTIWIRLRIPFSFKALKLFLFLLSKCQIENINFPLQISHIFFSSINLWYQIKNVLEKRIIYDVNFHQRKIECFFAFTNPFKPDYQTTPKHTWKISEKKTLTISSQRGTLVSVAPHLDTLTTKDDNIMANIMMTILKQ